MNARLLLGLGVLYLGALAAGIDPAQILLSWIESQLLETISPI